MEFYKGLKAKFGYQNPDDGNKTNNHVLGIGYRFKF